MSLSKSRHVRRSALLLVALIVIALLPASPARAQNDAEQIVGDYVKRSREELAAAGVIAESLKSRATVALGVTVLAAMLSLTGGLMPQLKRKWAKPAALMLGFLPGTTTILNNNLYAVDPGLLEENAYDLEQAVAQMTTKLDGFGTIDRTKPDYQRDLFSWHDDVVQATGKFRDRREELRRPARRRSAPATGPGLFFVATLNAQSPRQSAAPPSWVRQTPLQDDRFVYFVGKGVDPDSLTDAKDVSRRDAARQAEMYVAGRAAACPIAALRDRAAAASEVTDTYFSLGTVEGNMRAYTYSTLLRVTKAAVEPPMLQAVAAGAYGEVVAIRFSRVAAPKQLGGGVGVFVGPATAKAAPGGDLSTRGPGVQILVFSTPKVVTRWPPTRSVRYEELRKSLSPAQILQDAVLAKCVETVFRSGDRRYVLTVIDVRSGADASASVSIAPERLASARD